jgi:Membrane-associated phospholipid phosphatase
MIRIPLLLTLLFFFSHASYGQNADIKLLREINLNRNKSLDGTFKIITKTSPYISVALPISMLGIGLVENDSTLARKAIVIGTSVVAAGIITQVMKKCINRTRPFVTYPDIECMTSAGSASFPSGHTSDAFSLAASLSMEYSKWYVVVPSYAWATTVAYSRLHLGVHYPSDVLAGAAIGIGSAYLCHYLNKKLFKQTNVVKWLPYR